MKKDAIKAEVEGKKVKTELEKLKGKFTGKKAECDNLRKKLNIEMEKGKKFEGDLAALKEELRKEKKLKENAESTLKTKLDKKNKEFEVTSCRYSDYLSIFCF